MKVFVSSLITGMRAERDAAREAVESLDYQAVMAEDFSAQPNSPQVACLAGIRDSAVVVLILGAKYGATQPSGLSATHEEYREARRNKAIFAFIAEGIDPDAQQKQFIQEVQAWDSGLLRRSYSDPATLRRQITQALNRWQKSNAAAPLNPEELLKRATGALPSGRHERSLQGPALVVSLATGPTQEILRPSQLEAEGLARELIQQAMFGPAPVFELRKASDHCMQDDALLIAQERGGSIRIDGQGSLLLLTPISEQRSYFAIIQEDVQEKLSAALSFMAWVLDKVDPTQRLTHFVLVVTIAGASHLSWRTRAEDAASPNSGTMRISSEAPRPVHLTPAQRPRGELLHSTASIVDDITTLLRRQLR